MQPNVIRYLNPDATEKEELPASLSREMLTGVLRERFGFNGVIITDATIMGGYTMAMPRNEGIPTSIQAGCDMICFSTDIYEDIRYVKEGLEQGMFRSGHYTCKRYSESCTCEKGKLPEDPAGCGRRRCHV